MSATRSTMSRPIEGAPDIVPGRPSSTSAISAFARRYPLLTYFGLTLLISWGGVFLVVVFGPGRFPVTVEEFRPYLAIGMPAMLAGPVLAGVLTTALTAGRAGLRRLQSRLLNWRVGGRWYAVALLAAPLAVLAALVPLSLLSADFLPAILTTDDRAALVMIGVTTGLAAGVFEEIGWTGFAAPRLAFRRNAVMSGLLLGGVWGLWHVVPWTVQNGTPTGTLNLQTFLPNVVFFLAVLPVFRVLMIMVYARTESGPVAMLMHAALSATAPWILAPQVTGWALAGAYISIAALLWVIVAAVAARTRRHGGAIQHWKAAPAA